MTDRELISEALKARENSYCPYSNFAVGASLLTNDGKVYTGANIENSSFGATNCAERTVFFKAVSEGEKSFKAIAIAGGTKGESPRKHCFPCGICRQVMAEFCDPYTFTIIVAVSESDYQKYKLKELLPNGFGAENLE